MELHYGERSWPSELYLNDEDEYGVDESAVGVLVPPLLRAVRHVVDAHDAGHGARQVHDVLLQGLSSHGSPMVLGKRLPLPLSVWQRLGIISANF